jgi:valyl-tRNA synthetase
MMKLGNDKFVNSAPPKVVDLERKKQADAESRIRVIEVQIENLKHRT